MLNNNVIPCIPLIDVLNQKYVKNFALSVPTY